MTESLKPAHRDFAQGPDIGRVNIVKDLLSKNQGTLDFAILARSGAVTDGQTFTIGNDVYEFHQINTDTGVDTANGELNNADTGNVVITIPDGSHLGAGSVLRVQNEYLYIVSATKTDALARRGAFGSTVVAHANGLNIHEADGSEGLGNLVIPYPAAWGDGLLKPAVDWWSEYGGVKNPVGVVNLTTAFLFYVDVDAGLDTAETMTNGTITDFGGGAWGADTPKSEAVHTVVAADVTATVIRFVMPFDIEQVFAEVYNADGAAVAWDGDITVSDDRLVVVDNTGSTDWAADYVVRVTAYG